MGETIKHGESPEDKLIRFSTPIGEISADHRMCLLRMFGPGYENFNHLEIQMDDDRILGLPIKPVTVERLLLLGYASQLDMEPNAEDIEWYVEIQSQRFDSQAATFFDPK